MSTLEDSKHYFEEKLSKDLSDEQTATIFGKAEKKLKKVTDSAINAWKSFDNVLSKANNPTKEHMEEVHQKITEKIQGIEMEVGDFAAKKFNEVAKRIMSNLNNSTEYFAEMLSNRSLTDEQTGADFKKAQKKLRKITDFALDARKIFENDLQKANNSTREHMNAVHQKITRRIQGIEMKVRDFAEEIKHAKKEAKFVQISLQIAKKPEAKKEEKPEAEEEDLPEDEEEEKPEAEDNNEKKPFMMGGKPTSIDISKLNQCPPGYGFHIRGVKKCVKDPEAKIEQKRTHEKRRENGISQGISQRRS